MEILLLGDLGVLTHDICSTLAAEYRVVLYGNADHELGKIRNVRLYQSEVTQQDVRLEKLFRTYSFDAVVLFSPAMLKKPDWAGENAWLHTVLDLCRAHHIARTVYVTLDVMRLETREPGAYEDYEILLRNDTERLYRFYSQSLNLTVLRVPYIYDFNDVRYPLRQLLQMAHDSSRLYFAYSPDTKIDFVSMRDLTALLLRVLDSSQGGEYTVQVDRHVTVQDLQEALKKVKPELTVRYNMADVGMRVPRLQQTPDEGLRRDFGWVAKDSILDTLGTLYLSYKPISNEKPLTLLQRVRRLYARVSASALLRFISITTLFAIFVLLNLYTQDSAEFSFIDMYLLFVTLVGTVYGLNSGVYAAVLVCAATLFGYAANDVDIQNIFYNMENWMPFVFYLMMGAVLGYMHDDRRAQIRYAQQEHDVIEGKYLFVKSAYEDMLVTKQELKKQVLGAHESFGRIYDITRRLDKNLPSEIMSETLKAIETTLGNHTIVIYMIDGTSNFGRLTVCSGAISREVRRSIDLSQYGEIMGSLAEGTVWCNTEALGGYPSYCASIYEDGVPVYLVFVNDVPFEQMSTFFVNQIKILCGLCQGAFMRSLKEERGEHIKRCIPGTELLKPEWFAQALQTNASLKENRAMDYILCCAGGAGHTPAQLDATVSPLMRATDTAGLDAAGRLYVLFTQASAADFPVIQKRYRAGGLTLKMEEDGEFTA